MSGNASTAPCHTHLDTLSTHILPCASRVPMLLLRLKHARCASSWHVNATRLRRGQQSWRGKCAGKQTGLMQLLGRLQLRSDKSSRRLLQVLGYLGYLARIFSWRADQCTV
jgi:hypothetical protein